jgi:hypothetical protein
MPEEPATAGSELPAVPRPFKMHWGSGQIVEEARAQGHWTCPAIQLMRHDDGEAAGSYSLRFCHFSHDGQFRRYPMMLADVDIDGLRDAVAQTPRIRELLLRITGAE